MEKTNQIKRKSTNRNICIEMLTLHTKLLQVLQSFIIMNNPYLKGKLSFEKNTYVCNQPMEFKEE